MPPLFARSPPLYLTVPNSLLSPLCNSRPPFPVIFFVVVWGCDLLALLGVSSPSSLLTGAVLNKVCHSFASSRHAQPRVTKSSATPRRLPSHTTTTQTRVDIVWYKVVLKLVLDIVPHPRVRQITETQFRS